MLPDRIRPLTETVKECWLLCARQRQLSNAVSGFVSTTQLPFSWEAQSLIWLVLLIPLGHVALLLCVQYEHRLVWWLVLSFPIPQLAGHYISKTSVWVWVRVRCAILQLEARTMDSQLRSFATRVWTCQWFWRKKTGPGPQSPNKLEMECCTKEIAPWQDAVLDLDVQIRYDSIYRQSLDFVCPQSPGSLYVEKLGVSSTAQASLNNSWPMTGGVIMAYHGYRDL